MRAAIKRLIREGKTKEEILQYFAAQFGEGILTAPPKRGFNLVAYVGPFVGLVLGALIATLAVRRWSAAGRRSAPASSESLATQAPLDEAMKRRIEEELSKLDKEG
jgi:cytochrome c-type biogenesis protein CcmH